MTRKDDGIFDFLKSEIRCGAQREIHRETPTVEESPGVWSKEG